MNHKTVENVKRDRERIRYAERFGKEVPHCRPRVWVRLPLNFRMKLRPVISIMLNSLFTRLQYKARILIPKNFFYLYKPPLDLSLIKNFPARITYNSPVPRPVCEIPQFPNPTLRLKLYCDRD